MAKVNELQFFENKKVLMFAPSFFGYEKQIRKRIEDMGAKVDFFDERPSNNVWAKIFLRFFKSIMLGKIDRYYKKIDLCTELSPYDIVFVINIEAMPVWFITKLRQRNLNSHFILYMWDAIFWKRNILNYVDFFHRVYSFDRNDCEAHSDKLIFRPLFYLNDYAEIAKETKQKYKYDLTFIGSAHTDRYTILKKIETTAKKHNWTFFNYMFLQRKSIFYLYFLTNKNFRHCKAKEFSYRSLSKNEVLDIISNSKVIVDIQGVNQLGLTMRTTEVLGAKRKLITTNTEIAKYDFYSPDNILIIDREKPEISEDFIRTPYQETLAAETYHKYSLDGWLEDIFEIKNI
ncbi:MAG: hypothetical protein LBR17_00595 [Bacteroidales bacterium]|jgi:hypothetical protein|nr:hypothetical protein [Bacteroidales bacterium]